MCTLGVIVARAAGKLAQTGALAALAESACLYTLKISCLGKGVETLEAGGGSIISTFDSDLQVRPKRSSFLYFCLELDIGPAMDELIFGPTISILS
ncbi:hypothetical protein RRG08_033631 [Elysia crispata]|uniref:Uncharacterized protein n=1 Tax=Elysia crispata TaxID=231223 RepID=A0AAE0XS88_9GAST|nr:hypothetical protein RRG08_033631 [Elysia crispata]